MYTGISDLGPRGRVLTARALSAALGSNAGSTETFAGHPCSSFILRTITVKSGVIRADAVLRIAGPGFTSLRDVRPKHLLFQRERGDFGDPGMFVSTNRLASVWRTVIWIAQVPRPTGEGGALTVLRQ